LLAKEKIGGTSLALNDDDDDDAWNICTDNHEIVRNMAGIRNVAVNPIQKANKS
jgi:hypothetical protein